MICAAKIRVDDYPTITVTLVYGRLCPYDVRFIEFKFSCPNHQNTIQSTAFATIPVKEPDVVHIKKARHYILSFYSLRDESWWMELNT